MGDGKSATATPLPGAEEVLVHSLTWLVVANGIGLLLASLLLAPQLGELLGPFGYGRWVPLHLDLHLYGWCSLPLVGLLFRAVLAPDFPRRWAAAAVGLWSAVLAFTAVWWLMGGSSGKLFAEWWGPPRLFFPLALVFLEGVLVAGFWQRLRRRAQWGEEGEGREPVSRLVAQGALLVVLAAVPGAIFLATGSDVYPPINPDSGGATGAALVGSTLGIVTAFWALPWLLGLEASDGGTAGRRTGWLLILHFAVFALLDHGDTSNHDPLQIAALASLAVWPPLVAYRLRPFSWSATARRWLGAMAVWSVLLVATGVLGFLPGVLERWKFTNALVAHAHIAMAGLVTCWMVVILESLNRGSRLHRVFADPARFWAWQLGCGLYVTAMLVLGTLEGFDPGLVMRAEALSQTFYGLRWGAGALMLWASVGWLTTASKALRRVSETSTQPAAQGSQEETRCDASAPAAGYEEAA
ncbi:MAG: hypothetical protein SX243_16500 [Acidobacteriota bacterium]|nr:hypothetical protein [Acidobacteriota bacterium]